MSMVMNKGVKKGCKGVSANLFAILCILVEPSTAISEKRVILRNILPLCNLPLQ